MMGLREARLAAGYTQQSLADALGVSQAHIYAAENGKSGLSDDVRRRMIAELGRDFTLPARPGLPPGDPKHGTAGGYSNYHCTCLRCVDAWAEFHASHGYQDRYRDRLLAGKTECVVDGCSFKPDRSYPRFGYCHRHNIEFGVKPARP